MLDHLTYEIEQYSFVTISALDFSFVTIIIKLHDKIDSYVVP